MTEIKTVADLKFHYANDLEDYHGAAPRVAFVGDMVIEIIETANMNYINDDPWAECFLSTEITDKDGTIKVGYVVERSSCDGCYNDYTGCDDDDSYDYDYYDFDLRFIGNLPIAEIKPFMQFMKHFQRVKALAKEERALFGNLQLMNGLVEKLKESKYYELAQTTWVDEDTENDSPQ